MFIDKRLFGILMDDKSQGNKTGPISDADFDSETIAQRDTAIIHANNHLRRLIGTKREEGELSQGSSQSEIVLMIRGMTERLPFKQDLSASIGRVDLRLGMIPDIDLTRYGAEERGVSREHARLEVKGGKLFLIDLNSTNGTYIDGERIQPMQPYEVRSGDEFLVGRVAIRLLIE